LTQIDDFSNTSPESFDRIAKNMINRLLIKAIMGRAILAMNVAAILVGVLICTLSVLAWPIELSTWLRVVLPFLWATAFMLRGAPIEYLLSARYGNRQTKLGRQRSVGTTTHVFCSTDLVTANPFFFVDYCGIGGTYGALGWAFTSELSVAAAVRASAAMPGAFPPRTLWSGRLNFVNDAATSMPKPPWFHLADGGVWDNLATQWFSGAGAAASDWEDVVTCFDDMPSECPPGSDSINNLLVLDARGWGLGFSRGTIKLYSLLLRIPLLSELLTLLRSSSIQYQNTLAPRIDGWMESLRLRMTHGGPNTGVAVCVGTLTDYPFDRGGTEAWNVIPQQVREELDADPSLWMSQECVQQLPDHLQAIVDYSAKTSLLSTQSLQSRLPEWLGLHYADVLDIYTLWTKCSDIGTNLSALSKPEVVALLVHGYVQAMGAASLLIAVETGKPGPLPIEFPGFERFEMLFRNGSAG
jgi:hypothetical protein